MIGGPTGCDTEKGACVGVALRAGANIRKMMHGVEYQRDCVADYAVVTSQDDPSTIALEATNNAGESDIATGNETNEEAQLMNKASWLSCYTNLTSTIVGAGVLGMPYAFASAGWLSGTVLLTISAASSALAVHFLSVCTRKTKMPSSFYAVADVAFPPARFAIDAAVALKCFGVATSYLIVVGDLMPYAMEYWETPLFWQRRELWILLAFSFIAPLSYCESLDALKYTSGMSLLFILYLVFVVILFAIPSYDADGGTCGSEQHPCRGAIQANNLSVATLQILPVYIFGYTCQQNTFALVNELNHPVQRRIDSVIVASFGSSFLVYFVVAVCGYLTFGDNIKSDLLRTYPDTGLTTTARVLVSLIVACHYPLQAHPARKCVMTLLDGLSKSCSHATPTLRDEDLPASTVVTNPLSSHGLIELREHSSRHGSDVETRYKAEQSETKGFGLYLGLPEQSETTHISKSENQPSARRGGVCARLPPSLRISTYRMKMLSITVSMV